MTFGRSIALGFALLLAAGCSGGSPGSSAPPFPARKAPVSAALSPQDSPAGRVILAHAGAPSARAPQGWSGDGDDDADDGDWGTLNLPKIVACGDGTFATDCRLWRWGDPNATRIGSSGVAPVLNFCRDAGQYPTGDLGPPAIPIFAGANYSFTLTYLGTKPAPIVAFATRWWNISFDSGFSGGGKTGNAIVSPLLTGAASRGWLVYFTWSWPADILVVPYAINEIQLAATSSPLGVPPGATAPLGAFDCLGRPITAHRFAGGNSFGFGPTPGTPTFTSAGPELNAPVYGGANPNGSISLRDDKGARTITTVVPAAPGPTATPSTPPTTR
jgi:hypothetical protein